jgi:hypothetical protein
MFVLRKMKEEYGGEKEMWRNSYVRVRWNRRVRRGDMHL